MLKAFFEYLKFEKQVSKHTIEAYERDLAQFKDFFDKNYPHSEWGNASTTEIRSWVVFLMNNHIQPRSINRKLSSLRAFYRFLLKNGYIDANPLSNIKALKSNNKLPDFIHEEELKGLLNKDLFPKTFAGWRDRLVLELLYGCGLRLQELINIKPSDFDYHKSTLKVLGKGNKTRVLPLFPGLITTVDAYLYQKENIEQNSPHSHLIVTEKGKPAYPMLIYRIVRKYLDQVTTVDKRSPHVLRHSFATHLLEHGAELNAIKELLGHADLSATQVYTHNVMEQLKNAYDQAHPKA